MWSKLAHISFLFEVDACVWHPLKTVSQGFFLFRDEPNPCSKVTMTIKQIFETSAENASMCAILLNEAKSSKLIFGYLRHLNRFLHEA